MNPELWEQITKIYHSALELESREQEAFIEKACAGDEFLCREIKSLLAADRNAGDFIAENAFKDSHSLPVFETLPSLSGQKLGHYQILTRIGSGGMGEVYLANDTRLNRQIAVKTLPISLSKHPDHLKRFKIEAKAAATLNHPNVATIYSVEEMDGQPFYTMEFVEGKTLDNLTPNTGLEIHTFLEWFIDLADAFAHAHENGVVHRDIKPGNIMITAAGVPKILDFGLAQTDNTEIAHEISTSNLTQPGQILGTPAYMSPEQAEGERIDHRSDIFSLGVVMYEAITGQRPFSGDNYASIIRALLTKEPPPITEIRSDLPILLVRLILKCLDKSPRRRFQSMHEIRTILREIKSAEDAGVSLERSSSTSFFKQGHPAFVWIGMTAMLLFITFAGFALYYLTRETSSPISFENLTLRKLSQTSNVVYSHITPDGKSVAYNMIEEGEQRSLWIRRIEDRNSLRLLPPQALQFWGGLTISADGNQIYYITARPDDAHGTLYRISSLGGTPRKLVEKVNDLGSLSPDGERVLFVRYGKKTQILSANAFDGSDEREIAVTDFPHLYRDPQFSSDGRKVFFIKFEIINGEEYWSLAEIPAEGGGGGQERIIIPARKPKISEIAVLKDDRGLLLNATDPISNLSQLFYLPISGEPETRITNDLNSYFGISVSSDGETIVASQRQTVNDIWIVPAENREQGKKITNESNIYSTAVWTPDGRIVYDALDNNRPHIRIMNGDGSNSQQLTPNDSFDYEPRVSPDGRHIVFTSERTGEKKVWRMNIDGSNQQNLTPVRGRTYNPTFTPDGKDVLFIWNKEDKRVLGTVPLTSDGKLSEQSLFTDSFFSFSPDGKQIAYVTQNKRENQRRVCVRPVGLNEDQACFEFSPIKFLVWTTDGKGLLYRNVEYSSESDSTVWLQPLPNGEAKPFLSVKPDSVSCGSQSLDGRQFAVVRGKFQTDAVMITKISPE